MFIQGLRKNIKDKVVSRNKSGTLDSLVSLAIHTDRLCERREKSNKSFMSSSFAASFTLWHSPHRSPPHSLRLSRPARCPPESLPEVACRWGERNSMKWRGVVGFQEMAACTMVSLVTTSQPVLRHSQKVRLISRPEGPERARSVCSSARFDRFWGKIEFHRR